MTLKSGAQYRLRQATEEDREFLYGLHVAALKEYVEATWGWDEIWQRNYFQKNFDPEKYQIVVVDATDIGVISIEEREGALYLSLVELLPAHQGRGIGSALIRDFIRMAHERKRTATLEVLRVNSAARRLYLRLGFRITGENQYKFDMACPP